MNKWISVCVYILLAAFLVVSIAVVVPVYRKYKVTQQEVAEMRRVLESRKSEYQKLRDEIHDLDHYSFAIEKIARDKYGYSREGEIVFLYEE